MVLWRKIIISKPSVWFGVDGNKYEKDRWIGVIFYTMDDVKKRNAWLITNFSGGGDMVEALRNVNNYSKSPVTTEKKVKAEIERFAREIEKNPKAYAESTDY